MEITDEAIICIDLIVARYIITIRLALDKYVAVSIDGLDKILSRNDVLGCLMYPYVRNILNYDIKLFKDIICFDSSSIYIPEVSHDMREHISGVLATIVHKILITSVTLAQYYEQQNISPIHISKADKIITETRHTHISYDMPIDDIIITI